MGSSGINAISLPVQSRHFGQTVFFFLFLGIFCELLSTPSLYRSNLAISDKLYFFPIFWVFFCELLSTPSLYRSNLAILDKLYFFLIFWVFFVNYCQRHLSTGPISPFRTNCIFSYFLGIFCELLSM